MEDKQRIKGFTTMRYIKSTIYLLTYCGRFHCLYLKNTACTQTSDVIRLEGQLCGAERDLLAIAKYLVTKNP